MLHAEVRLARKPKTSAFCKSCSGSGSPSDMDLTIAREMKQEAPRADSVESRFDADTVVRTATRIAHGRLEIELRDAQGNVHVVSLPLAQAVDLGCLISDVSENAPYLIGGFRRNR